MCTRHFKFKIVLSDAGMSEGEKKKYEALNYLHTSEAQMYKREIRHQHRAVLIQLPIFEMVIVTRNHNEKLNRRRVK